MFQGTCKKLTCPVLTAPFFGVCREAILQTYGLVIEANYKLEPLWANSTTTKEDASFYKTIEVGEAIFMKMLESTGFLDEKCQMLRFAVSIANEEELVSTSEKPLKSPAYYIVTTSYVTVKSCQHHLIVARMTEISGQSVSVGIGGQGIMYFTVRLIQPSLTENADEPIFAVNKKAVGVSRSYSVNSLMACPSIRFTKREYAAIIQNVIDTQRREAIMSVFDAKEEFDKNNDSDISVCLGAYMDVATVHVVNNGSVKNQEMTFGLILCIILLSNKAVLL